MSPIIIKKTNDEFGDTRYDFIGETDYGEEYDLGHATQRIQDEGTEDEMIWWEGRIDGREIMFWDEEDLESTIKRHNPHSGVYFY